jgi:dCTP diphosphatase
VANNLSDMAKLITMIAEFNKARDWDKFHSPKNLAESLSIEAAELMEIFQWMSEDGSFILDSTKAAHLKEEVGDIMIYLTNISNKFGFDPITAAKEKIEINEKKYPANVVRGKAKKYSEY